MKNFFKILKLNLFVTLFLVGSIYSQSSSTYSRFGIGDIFYANSAKRLAMGQLGTSLADESYISIINPAAWNTISRTRMEFSFRYSGISVSNDANKTYYDDSRFSGFSFGFPISKDNGVVMAMGLIPVSRVSYKAAEKFESTTNNKDDYIINYSGDGGLSKVFVGLSFKLPFDLSFGGTLDYYFGNLEYESKVTFINLNQRSGSFNKRFTPQGLGTTIGVITPDISKIFSSGNFKNLRLGASAIFLNDLNTDTILTSTSVVEKDTVSSGVTKMHIPARYSFGLSFNVTDNYRFAFDYLYQEWNKFSINNTVSNQLQRASKISAGFEYKPDYEINKSAWEQISWRFGLSYEKSQYKINNTSIEEYSIAGGFSYPLAMENTIDVAIQYSIRGKNEANLFKENTIRLNIGLSLGETWFLRR